MAVSCVADTSVVVRSVPLKLTTELLLKPVPFTVSTKSLLPATAEAGAKLVMTGAGLGAVTVNVLVLVAVPLGVVTAMAPDVAPVGTTKERVVALATVNPVMVAPFSVIALAFVKLVPVTVTVVPIGPLAGVKLAMAGAGATGAKARPRNSVLVPAVATASGRVVLLGAAL